MSSRCTWLYDLGSLKIKQKRCSLFKLLLVKHHLAWGWSLPSHYWWCRRAFKETWAVHLRCFVACVRLLSDDEDWDWESRHRSSTQGAAKHPFSHHGPSRPRKSQNSFDQSWADAVTVLSSVQEEVMRPWPRMSLACHWRRSASYRLRDPGRRLRQTPRNFQAFFLKCQERTTYQNSLRCN